MHLVETEPSCQAESELLRLISTRLTFACPIRAVTPIQTILGFFYLFNSDPSGKELRQALHHLTHLLLPFGIQNISDAYPNCVSTRIIKKG